MHHTKVKPNNMSSLRDLRARITTKSTGSGSNKVKPSNITLITLVHIIVLQIAKSSCSTYSSSHVPFKTSFISSSDYTLRARNGALVSFPLSNNDEVARLADALVGEPEATSHLETPRDQESKRVFLRGGEFLFARNEPLTSQMSMSESSDQTSSSGQSSPVESATDKQSQDHSSSSSLTEHDDLMQAASSSKSGPDSDQINSTQSTPLISGPTQPEGLSVVEQTNQRSHNDNSRDQESLSNSTIVPQATTLTSQVNYSTRQEVDYSNNSLSLTDSNTTKSVQSVTEQPESPTLEITVNPTIATSATDADAVTTTQTPSTTMTTTTTTTTPAATTTSTTTTTTEPIMVTSISTSVSRHSNEMTNQTSAETSPRGSRSEELFSSDRSVSTKSPEKPSNYMASFQFQAANMLLSNCANTRTNCSFSVASIPVIDPTTNTGNKSTDKVVNEFVFVPQDAPLAFDESSYPINKAINKPFDIGDLKAEHRGIDDSEEASASDDLELDYMNPGPDKQQTNARANSVRPVTVTGSPLEWRVNGSTEISVSQEFMSNKTELGSSSTLAPSQQKLSTPSSLEANKSTVGSIIQQASSTTNAPLSSSTTSNIRPNIQSTSSQSKPQRFESMPSKPATTNKPAVKSTPRPAVRTDPTAASSRFNSFFRFGLGSSTRKPPTQSLRGWSNTQREPQSLNEYSSNLWRHFSPTANGADEEEARILSRYSVPSQLSRINSSATVENSSKPKSSLNPSVRPTRLSDQKSTVVRSRKLDFVREKADDKLKESPPIDRAQPELARHVAAVTTSAASTIAASTTTTSTQTSTLAARNVSAKVEQGWQRADSSTRAPDSVITSTVGISDQAKPVSMSNASVQTSGSTSQFVQESTKPMNMIHKSSSQSNSSEEILTLIAETATLAPRKLAHISPINGNNPTQSVSQNPLDLVTRRGGQMEANKRIINQGSMKSQLQTNSYASKRRQTSEEAIRASKQQDESRLSELLEELAQLADNDRSTEQSRPSTEAGPTGITQTWLNNVNRSTGAATQTQIGTHTTTTTTTNSHLAQTKVKPPQLDATKWNPIEPSNDRSSSSSVSQVESQPNDLLPGRPGTDYPTNWQVPKTSFDCRNFEQSGFYADVESGCQAYHSCHKGRGGQHTFLCPNGTLFSQELLTCDWWYNVECSNSAGSKLVGPNNLDRSFIERPANELSAS